MIGDWGFLNQVIVKKENRKKKKPKSTIRRHRFILFTGEISETILPLRSPEGNGPLLV
jgi:hypothetical protein